MNAQKLLFALATCSPALAFATAPTAEAPAPATENLEAKLDELKLPANQAPAGVSSEHLYAVQTRYSNLSLRPEVSVGGAYNFGGSTFLKMTQLDTTLRFHITNRFDISASYSRAYNEFTSGANELLALGRGEQALVDTALVMSRKDVLIGFNAFYGKLRFSMDNVLYFDQYVAVGPGKVDYTVGASGENLSATSAVADVGFVFWMGRYMSLRAGVKNELFHEKRVLSEGTAYHALGHVDLGIVFGSFGRGEG